MKTKTQRANRHPSYHRNAHVRRKKLRNTLFLLMLLCILVLGAIAGSYVIKDHRTDSLEKSFNLQEELPIQEERGGVALAASFAGELCVGEAGNVELEGVTLPENQRGALFDLENHKVLYAQGLYDKVYPASITKIMTAIVALKYGNMDELVTVSETVLNLEAGSQVCGLMVGDQLTMDQLLHCLIVYSGNDAAAAIAENIAGNAEDFVALMNEEARNLGCTGTHFTNPHGLQDTNHYTTPYDIYLMLNEALHYDHFVDIMQLDSYTIEPQHSDGTKGIISLVATDHYLTGEATPPKDVIVLGGKTGTTAMAGNCLALLTQNTYGKLYISIVTGAKTKDLLYEQMNLLLENINP